MGRTIYRLKKVRKVNGEKSPGMLFFEGRPGWKVAPFITKSTEGVKLFLALHVEHLPQRWRFTYAPVIIVVDGDLHRYGPLEWPFYDSTALSFPTAEVAFKVTPEDPGAIADGKQVYLTVEAGTQFSLKLTAEQQADFRLILDKYKALAPTKETEPKKEGSQ